jgi:hypothetical protein
MSDSPKLQATPSKSAPSSADGDVTSASTYSIPWLMSSGPLDQGGGDVDSDDGCPAPRELPGDPPLPARQVEDPASVHVADEIEQRDRARVVVDPFAHGVVVEAGHRVVASPHAAILWGTRATAVDSPGSARSYSRRLERPDIQDRGCARDSVLGR